MGRGRLGSNGGRAFYIGESKKMLDFQTRKLSKNVKNLWKIYNFWQFYSKYCDVWKTLTKCSLIFSDKYRDLWKYRFVQGSGRGAITGKSLETGKCWKCSWMFREILLDKADSNKIKAALLEFSKALIILIDINKPRRRFLRVRKC